MAELKFEDALGRLEDIVKTLETGELPLEDSLKVFEEGVRLSKDCLRMLEEAERKVQILLTEKNGDRQPKPYEPEETG